MIGEGKIVGPGIFVIIGVISIGFVIGMSVGEGVTSGVIVGSGVLVGVGIIVSIGILVIVGEGSRDFVGVGVCVGCVFRVGRILSSLFFSSLEPAAPYDSLFTGATLPVSLKLD